MPTSGPSQTPTIRTFQFDGGGNLKKSVNLFRGDVNLNQKLLSLPGRLGKQGLDVHLSLFYQSNINQQATHWNVDHPTGVAGLGWDFSIERIVMDDNGSPSPITRTYYYQGSGGQNLLIREADTPFLFTLVGAKLQSGHFVDVEVQSLFAQMGILINNGAIAVQNGNEWSISDLVNQRLYKLKPQGNDFDVYEGGESYQLQNYKFWNILYYPEFERWVITKEDGTRHAYGGQIGTGSQKVGVNNGIEWGVRWGTIKSEREVGVWLGESAIRTNQQRYAKGWNLVQVEDIWGDTVQYVYNEISVTSTQAPGSDPMPTFLTGLESAELEQPVGSTDGLTYTKALYLTHIEDVFGRRVILKYNDKLYDTSAAEAPREYFDPHKSVPDTSPNAYQDAYETKYLDEILVIDDTGDLMFSLDFVYNPSPAASGRNREVANVTKNSDALKGATYKRFLTGIIKKNAAGNPLPGLNFAYYLSHSDENPGAIKNITHPEGAITGYTYNTQSLDICQRRIEIGPPTAVVPQSGQQPTPFLWFGPDYAVSIWYNSVSNLMSLTVYTWLGRWAGWQYTKDAILFKQSVNMESIQVIAQQNFFGLYFKAGTSTGQLYVFQKDLARPGLWQPMILDGKKQEPITYDLSQSSVTFAGGDSFLAVLTKNTVQNTSQLTSYVFNWPTRDWTSWCFAQSSWILSQNCSGNNCEIAGTYLFLVEGSEYLLFLRFQAAGNNQDAIFNLSYLDFSGKWQTGDNYTVPGIRVMNIPQDVSLAAGPSMASMSVKFNAAGTLETDVYNLQWDADYQFLPNHFHQQFKDHVPNGAELPSVSPTVSGNAMVGVAGHLMRYNGQLEDNYDWLVNENLAAAKFNYSSIQHYAFGQNYGVQGVYQGINEPTANLEVFDPSEDKTSWTEAALSLPVDHPTNEKLNKRANWPSGSNNDYFSIGRYIYPRYTLGGNSFWNTDWKTSVQNTPQPVKDGLSSETVLNGAPDFFCFMTQQSNGVYTETQPYTIKNGQLILQPPLSNEKYYTASDVANTNRPKQGGGPSGFGSFVTYPADAQTFDRAGKIFLYRFAGDAFAGNIVHRAVATISVDDGYGRQFSTYYDFNPATATCDPSGKVVKYYQSSVYPGCLQKSNSKEGYTKNQFFNGYKEDAHIVTYSSAQDANMERFSMLDGVLQIESMYAHGESTPVSCKTKNWYVYTARNENPATKAVKTLHGGYIRQLGQTHVLNGVSSKTTTCYIPDHLDLPYSGQVVQQVKKGYGALGKEEVHTKYKTYAYEFPGQFPVICALHILQAVVQTKTSVQEAGKQAIVSEASATIYSNWANSKDQFPLMIPGSKTNFLYRGPGPFSDFPFSAYQPGQTPAAWSLHSTVVARTTRGLVSETVDAGNYCHSLLYDARQQFPIASFSNASLQKKACFYAGFEPYEDSSNWGLGGAAQVIWDNANTGSGSLQLPGKRLGHIMVQLPVELSSEPTTYQLGFWYKTPSSFKPAPTAEWTVIVQQSIHLDKEIRFPFANTEEVWQYVTIGIPIPAGSGQVILEALATNGTDSHIWLDDIHINPLLSRFSAQVFDPAFKYVTAGIQKGGKIKRNLRDQFHQVVVQTAPGAALENQVKALNLSFLSRTGNSADVFQGNNPNATVTVLPAAAGTVETFRDGSSWQKRWQAANPGDWRSQNGTLTYDLTDNTVLALRERTNELPWALYFELAPWVTDTGTFGIQFGVDKALQWNGSNNYFSYLLDGKPIQTPIVSPPTVPRSWLLMQTEKQVLFYGDGALIFSVPSTPASNQMIQLFTDKGKRIGYRNLTHIQSPRLSVDFRDAHGKSRQTQNLFQGDAWVAQTLYDDLKRAVVQTKSVPASFGRGAGLPIMQYRDSIVTNISDFIQNQLEHSGVMQGDVADYYKGVKVGDFSPSNDEGYPYSRKRFEASPLGRIIEKGQSGKALAIINPGSTTPASRPTIQYAYGKNEGQTLSHVDKLPAANYLWEAETGSLKKSALRVVDVFKRPVVAMKISQGGHQKIYSLTFITHTEEGLTVTKQLPNYFSSGPQEDPEKFVEIKQYNFLNQLISQTTPDTGTTLYMYDKLGRLRFKKPNQAPLPKPGGRAENADKPYLLYYKYDPIGRILEGGTCDFDWNESTAVTLQQYADDPSWPAAASTPTVSYSTVKAFKYDGDGNTPSMVGMVESVITSNNRPVPGTIIEVEETFSYYLDGQVKTVSVEAKGCSAGKQTTTYQYNSVAQVTQIQLSAGKIPLVRYSYDEMGNLQGVGTGSNPFAYAQYQYNPDQLLSQEILTDGKLNGLYNYFSAGSLQQEQFTPEQHSNFLAKSCADYQYNNDQALTEVTSHIADGKTVVPYDANFGYDPLARLQSTTVSSDTDLNVTVQQYDDNDNLYQLSRAGKDLTFTYESGTDLIGSVQTEGAAAVPVGFDDLGRITTAPQLGTSKVNNLSYDKLLQLTGNIRVTSGTESTDVTFGYGNKGKRVLKRVVAGSKVLTNRLYVHGLNALPLLEIEHDGTVTTYIYGRGDLIAFNKDKLYLPIKDQQGSVRAVLDAETGAIEAGFTYFSFGGVKATGASPTILDYLYTGQEFDRETGLYNYRARLYDPWLCRFYAPDPKKQYASPYVYVGNNPINQVDPSGEFSWQWKGGEALGALEIATGTMLMFTFGGQAAGVGLIALGVAAVGYSTEHRTTFSWAQLGESEAGSAIGAAEIVAGATVTLATDGALGSTVGAALIGAGMSGISYSTFHQGKFSWGDFAKQELIGAAGGVVTAGIGAVGGAIGTALDLGIAANIGMQAGTGVVGGVASTYATKGVSLALSHKGWHFSWWTLASAGESAVLGGVGGAIGGAIGYYAREPRDPATLMYDDTLSLHENIARYDELDAAFEDYQNKVANTSRVKAFLLGKTGQWFPFNAGRVTALAKPAAFNLKKFYPSQPSHPGMF